MKIRSLCMDLLILNLSEIQFIFILIGVIVGYQISFYFLNQFKKFKSEHLGLNRLLLAYGLFFILGLTGIFFRNINKFYVEDLLLEEVFFRITNLFLISSILVFLSLVSSKSFRIIMNPSITKAFCLMLLVPFISIFFFQTGSIMLNLIMTISIFGTLFMLIFQFKLIKLSVGIIKKRIIYIFIGMLLILGSFLFGGEFSRNMVLQENEHTIIMFTSFLTIITFFIVFLGVYKFPAFLEFDWKDHLLKLYIIDKEVVKGLYNFNFLDSSNNTKQSEREKLLINNKDKVLSIGLIGINNIINGLTSTRDKKIERISQGDNQIIFTYGDNPNDFIIYALLVNKDMDSLRYFLETIKNQFQGFFKGILQNINSIRGNEVKVFSSFDVILTNLIR